MSTGLLPPLSEIEQYAGRRGLGSMLPPSVELITTEDFSNTPPVTTLITTEDFSNTPPEATIITTEDFENDPAQSALVTGEEFGGYDWNPNVLVEAVKAGGAHINVLLTLKQQNPTDSAMITIRSSPFGTILDLGYPDRDFEITAPAEYSEWDEGEQKTIFYDADTTSLTYTPSYVARTIFEFTYRRRAGQ